MTFFFLFVVAAPLLNGFRLPTFTRHTGLAMSGADMVGFDSDVIAPGTPFERPKIGSSIVDLIGATPMVLHFCCFIADCFDLSTTYCTILPG